MGVAMACMFLSLSLSLSTIVSCAWMYLDAADINDLMIYLEVKDNIDLREREYVFGGVDYPTLCTSI